MTYLGIVLDEYWTFASHFRVMCDKGRRVVSALARIMPNLGGSSERRRVLYLHVLHAVLLYGAPIWADKLAKNRQAVARCRAIQKQIAIRVICAYRTVSAEAALLLARAPSIELLARERAEIFRKLRSEDCTSDGAELRIAETIYTRALWLERLQQPDRAGRITREVIAPVFGQWLSRRHGSLTFYLTQLLTGHGCFNSYLYRKNRAPSDICAHCETSEDTNVHTLEECTAWSAERERLRNILSVPNISLSTMVACMVTSPIHWKAAMCFAERVLRAKKDAERERQRAALAPAT